MNHAQAEAATKASAERATRTLQKYLQLNQRLASELVKKKAGDVAIKLYQFTSDAAPTRSVIKGKLQSLGWRVKRRPGAWKRRPGETSQQVMERMHDAVANARFNRRFFVASGYLPAINVLRGSGAARRKTLKPVKNPRGSVEIQGINGGKPQITITNATPGIIHSNQKTDAQRKALDAVSDDIDIYIRKKLGENWTLAKG